MVDTIQEALNSFYLVAFLFGFGIFRHPLDYPRVRLSILYILSVWSIYAYVFYYVLTTWLTSRVTNLLIYFTIIMNLIVATITIIITTRKHKKFSVLINKLSQVDDTLQELGTPKEYRRMRNSIKWIIIIWFIIICITCTTDSLSTIELFNDNIKAFVIPIVMNYSFYINILIDIMVMFILRYIGTRYDKINDHIRQLIETKECGLRCVCKKSFLVTRHCSTEDRMRILWTAMHLHSQLYRIALDINGLFDIKMTLQTMSYFVTLTTDFYVQYHVMLCLIYNGDAVSWKFLLPNYTWIAIDLIRLISLNYICESVSAKAQKTEGIIHKLTNLIWFAKAREEICQFVLQISLRPLKFSGMDLFYFGHKFLYKFFVWVLSVIIIVIQMDTSPRYQIVSSKNNVMTCYDF